MDLMSTAQLLGNIGEFIGAIAVVVTLAYLAVQVRHSRAATEITTNAVQSSNYAAWNEASQSWGDFVAEHAGVLAANQAKTSLDQLSPEEVLVMAGLGVKTFNQVQAAFLHHSTGSLPDEVFDAHMNGFVDMFEFLPVLEEMWQLNRRLYAQSFVEMPFAASDELRLIF